jgi:aminopeptidase YwaD
MTDEEGHKLAALAGNEAVLEIRAQRRPATGCNVIARKGASTARRLVICAHIDAKDGTPGALDNAAGTITLLLLAELLAGYAGALGVEIVALNGEDYYSNPGEMQYLAQNAGQFDEIVLAANLDGLGYREGRAAFSLYECPPDLGATIYQIFKDRPDMVEGEPWCQGDHTMFVMNGRPALALTSERALELVSEIVHTAKDTLDLVDPDRLAAAAVMLRDLVLHMDGAGDLSQRKRIFEN